MTTPQEEPNWFEPEGWEGRYAGEGRTWSGQANPQLVVEASQLTPGTALDVGCGEGGDVVWLARQGWHVTGADFSPAGLRRAAQAARHAGVADRVEFWETDARTFTTPVVDGEPRVWDLVTSHYLHPADGGMAAVVERLATAVAPGGHLLVVGHAPVGPHAEMSESHRRAMFVAADLVPSLPAGFTPVVVEQRPRTVVREGEEMEIVDSTLLARREADRT